MFALHSRRFYQDSGGANILIVGLFTFLPADLSSCSSRRVNLHTIWTYPCSAKLTTNVIFTGKSRDILCQSKTNRTKGERKLSNMRYSQINRKIVTFSCLKKTGTNISPFTYSCISRCHSKPKSLPVPNACCSLFNYCLDTTKLHLLDFIKVKSMRTRHKSGDAASKRWDFQYFVNTCSVIEFYDSNAIQKHQCLQWFIFNCCKSEVKTGPRRTPSQAQANGTQKIAEDVTARSQPVVRFTSDNARCTVPG